MNNSWLHWFNLVKVSNWIFHLGESAGGSLSAASPLKMQKRCPTLYSGTILRMRKANIDNILNILQHSKLANTFLSGDKQKLLNLKILIYKNVSTWTLPEFIKRYPEFTFNSPLINPKYNQPIQNLRIEITTILGP